MLGDATVSDCPSSSMEKVSKALWTAPLNPQAEGGPWTEAQTSAQSVIGRSAAGASLFRIIIFITIIIIIVIFITNVTRGEEDIDKFYPSNSTIGKTSALWSGLACFGCPVRHRGDVTSPEDQRVPDLITKL
ncbi:hypothetical protein EYF80_001934 [Liparis tanakae]|uniref:Uncharacterized protein n=1 Tax=Liparis tanakae TaxID=230148 RepID=A0A4Z2JCT6_9TELE|nr:hypothetical protein EYF80_001934 [Liparis tanakae]